MVKTITVAIKDDDKQYIEANGLSPTSLLREKINEKRKSDDIDKILISSQLFIELKKEVIEKCKK